MSRITQQELESYLWGAAVLLRGLIDAGDPSILDSDGSTSDIGATGGPDADW